MSAADGMREWADKAKTSIYDIVQATAVLALEGVVTRSPVGNPEKWRNPPPADYVPGTFKANWNVGIGSPDLSTNLTEKDTTGGATIAKGIRRIDAASAIVDETIWITNSLSYAARLEYEGWSLQAPAGMARITVAALPAQVAAYINNLR